MRIVWISEQCLSMRALRTLHIDLRKEDRSYARFNVAPILINRIENLVELWKCLVTTSTNERVNLRQFKQAAKHWIAKTQQVPSLQDSNNNARERI
jgi:hypothetical protein